MPLKLLGRFAATVAAATLLTACGGGGGASVPPPPPTPPPPPDTTAPQTRIDAGPDAVSGQTTASISFSANESDSTFECRLNDGDIFSCESPHELTGLAEGEQRFEVRATDASGNTDASWAFRVWRVDLTAPTMAIRGAPRAVTSATRALFSFEADEADVTYECAIDDGGFSACANPHSASELAEGNHAIEVRPTDAAGNLGATVRHEWRVDLSATPSVTIGGTVSTPAGGEAGVWVIAETDDLPTGFRKIVVTDDQGRFLLPELPDAVYDVWARGYGLLDTAKHAARADHDVAIAAEPAPTAQEAAAVYPANYWYSLLNIPDASEFPGTGASGNGIGTAMRNQAWWLDGMKDRCQLCHQMGTEITRVFSDPDAYDSTREGWDTRVRPNENNSSENMNNQMNALGRPRALDVFTDWTDRIVAGEVPPAPPRPGRLEQNLVITQWEWGTGNSFVHDNISTDKRDPTRYPYGKVYGVSQTHSSLMVTDPVANDSIMISVPRREAGGGFGSNVHNPMFDDRNRVWLTSTIRRPSPAPNPEWCIESDHPSVQRFPIEDNAGRQLSYFDVATEEFVLIDTCYGTHHLQFAQDANQTLWTSGDYHTIGWLDMQQHDEIYARVLDESGDALQAEQEAERGAQGWCPVVLDYNGDGVLGEYTAPGAERDPTKDARIRGFAYGIIPNPADGSVWFTRPYPDRVPGQILRLDPATCLTEIYQPPYGTDAVPKSEWGFSPRGIDIDRNGILWTALSGSGHIASFDRSKCTVLNGPTATGQHCPEGWTLHPTPGPNMNNVETSGSADFHYYVWVDQFNALGLGENVPIANGTNSDSLIAWLPDEQRMVTLRVPYPLGFYTRGLDGRIDDADAGWKGRGVWASDNTLLLRHIEDHDDTQGNIMKFQFRPHPLAE